jgi:hypothetical protein
MSTEHPLSQPPVTLVTSYDIEHPHAIGRRIKAGLTLVGAAAAAVLALAAGSPAANADTADLPVFPVIDPGSATGVESLGVPPLFAGQAFEFSGTYTDLVGVHMDSTDSGRFLTEDSYGFPGNGSPFSIEGVEITDPDEYTSIQEGSYNAVDGDTFGAISTNSGLYNLFQDTPFFTQTASSLDLNDAFVYDPTGNPLVDPSGIDFGIQYLDLPDVATPVDEVNILGPGAEILFSIPVTGDLLSLF